MLLPRNTAVPGRMIGLGERALHALRRMPINAATIVQMEKELAKAREQLLRDDGERYRILIREISGEEKQRILDRLTDRHERILFGLEPPASGRAGERPHPARLEAPHRTHP
jgi:hypothetical protein